MANKAEVMQWTAAAETMLQSDGVIHIPNESPGLARAVFENLKKRFPTAHLTMERLPLGDEATFRSDDYLGAKASKP